jgi:glycosyltransferase involved in cell wall biosynthesis
METMVLALAQHQLGKGHELSIVTIYAEGELFEKARNCGVNVFALAKRPGKDTLLTVKKLKDLLGQLQPDVVHTHNLVPHYLVAAACWSDKSLVLLNTRHDMGEHFKSHRGDFLYRLAMRKSDHWVAVCEAAKIRFVETGVIRAKKGEVVVNGIDLTPYKIKNEDRKSALLSMLGISDSPLVLGSVGRINKVKDHQTMITAFANLAKLHPNTVLVIVGDGPNLAAVKIQAAESTAADKIYFLGQRSDVSEMMQGFDVFLQSSLTEGYSLALVEACATALPILATNVGGNGEIIEHGSNGYLVQTQDIDGYSSALVKLTEDVKIRSQFGAKSREWALKNGSIESMYARYDDLYRIKNR